MLFILLIFSFINISKAQKPSDGIYTYSISFAEWHGKSLGATCTVIIRGDSIKIIHNGNKNLSGKKGDIIEEGIIMKHIKTGKWIIAHNKDDQYAKETGECAGGPSKIDFKRKIFRTC